MTPKAYKAKRMPIASHIKVNFNPPKIGKAIVKPSSQTTQMTKSLINELHCEKLDFSVSKHLKRKMAAIVAAPLVPFFPLRKTHHRISPLLIRSSFISPPQQSLLKVKPSSQFNSFSHIRDFSVESSTFDSTSTTTLDGVLDDEVEKGGINPRRTIEFVFWVLVWTSVSLAFTATFGDRARAATTAAAASDSIRASSFGLKVANSLRGFGWPDEAIVFALATLPVIELRGAIPVGYWLQLKPVLLTVLAVLGNMVPVPFIVLYLKRFASFLAGRSPSASRFLDTFFESVRQKAGPVEEFQWLGLMLFVAVPFPGTGAWTGAIIASLFEMPFWSGVSANFCGVVLAGLLVNLLVNLGFKYAVVTGVILFFVSTFMWSILRRLKNPKPSSGN